MYPSKLCTTIENEDKTHRIRLLYQEIPAMRIVFYKSVLCPRCYLAKKYLLAVCSTLPDVQIEEVEFMKSPVQAWQEGIRMVPTVKIGDNILSGLYLNKELIANFVAHNYH